jgi:tetratricopeptide (TPR) repeat protein
MHDQNLYELLQVSESADPEIIQAAYRRLILRYHPDRSSEPNAAEMTQRLNDAYAVLSDPIQRAKYDRERRDSTSRPSSRTGQNPPKPPPSPNSPKPTEQKHNGFPLLPMVIGVLVISVVGAMLVLGSSQGGNVPVATVATVAPTEAPTPTQPLAIPIPTSTLYPTPTDKVMVVVPTPTPRPIPTSTPNASSYYDKGQEYLSGNHFIEAIREFDIALIMDPKYLSAYWDRGIAYSHLGEQRNAINNYTRALQLTSNETFLAALHSNRGQSYRHMGLYQNAINDYTKSIQLNYPYPGAGTYNYRGLSYFGIGQYQLAIDDYSEAIQISANFSEAYFNRGVAYRNLGLNPASDSDLTMACTLNNLYC